MRKELKQEIGFPEGVEVIINGGEIVVKGPEGENKRIFNFGKLNVEKKDKKIIIENEESSKREKRMMNTISSHIRNMIKGVQEKFEYQVKVCSGHFPMTIKVEGNEVQIKNFLGEKIPRKVKIPEGVEMDIQKEIITLKSVNKELAGQAAANFEKATKIRGRDIRVTQDGIYIINKAGKEM